MDDLVGSESNDDDATPEPNFLLEKVSRTKSEETLASSWTDLTHNKKPKLVRKQAKKVVIGIPFPATVLNPEKFKWPTTTKASTAAAKKSMSKDEWPTLGENFPSQPTTSMVKPASIITAMPLKRQSSAVVGVASKVKKLQ